MSASAELQHLLTIPVDGLNPLLQSNPIAVAHAALEHIRDTGDPSTLFLRCMVEIAQNYRGDQEELLFHCVTGARQVLLWQWTKHFSVPFLRLIRDYVMLVGDEIPSRTVRQACYATAAAFWKRSWNANNEVDTTTSTNPVEQSLAQMMQAQLNVPALASPSDLFAYLEQAIQSKLEPTVTFLQSLVSEFSGKSAVSYRLPLEFHRLAHRSFETKSLLRCLKLALSGLGHVLSVDPDESTIPTIQLSIDVISWEFGMAAWDTGHAGAASTARILLRPPVEWREALLQTNFIPSILRMHEVAKATHPQLAHSLRQLFLVFASLSGPVFSSQDEKKQYADYLVLSVFELWQKITIEPESSELLDAIQLIGRLIGNYRMAILVQLPSLLPLLKIVADVGNKLLSDHIEECRQAGGDVENMEYFDWREEALSLLLDCTVMLASDPWLLYSGTEESRQEAQRSLSTVLGPLYEGFVRGRIRFASMEEHYFITNDEDLDETKEEILAMDLVDEITAVSTLGRLNLPVAIGCLSDCFSQTLPKLQSFWSGSGPVTAEVAALLEESRLLTMYICQLLTDDNEGETPAIPEAVMVACGNTPALAGEVASAVGALFQFAEAQVRKIASDPTNKRLSPLLAKSFMWFLHRWAPAYIYPSDSSISDRSNPIALEWSNPERSQWAINFCTSLSLYYQSFWPHEKQVQQTAARLLMALAKRGDRVRALLVESPSFRQMIQHHCLTAGIRHSAAYSEFEVSIRGKANEAALPSLDMVWGYQRLPYDDRSQFLRAMLVACGDMNSEVAAGLLTVSLKCIHEAFTTLVQALAEGRTGADDIQAREMACLCVEMFIGVVHASEMPHSERIPQFMTPYLPQLSGLMKYFADDLKTCETLLRLFCDFTENFVAVLDPNQCLSLFNSSGELLRSYSSHHCEARVVAQRSSSEADAVEEQAYGDILCAIQLLTNLGAKDFIDVCKVDGTGVESKQVTDMIFFGLQQILPLMTKGLLQYPTLCEQFFELVGFMVDNYPEQVGALPADLYQSIMDALLFGMGHVQAAIAKNSLHGLASLFREHLCHDILAGPLAQKPDLLDECTRRLLQDVVFQSVVIDRVEAAGMALLPLIAVDLARFGALVQALTQQASDPARLQAAFDSLVDPSLLANAAKSGYEGRIVRVKFKKNFETFVSEVHSFLVIK